MKLSWSAYIKVLQQVARWPLLRLCVSIMLGLSVWWLLIVLGPLAGQSFVYPTLGMLWCLIWLFIHQVFGRAVPIKPATGIIASICYALKAGLIHLTAVIVSMVFVVALFWSLKLLSVILRHSV